MNRSKMAAFCIIMSVAAQLIFIDRACAYIDPGSGGYLMQLLVGVVMGIAFSFKLFWNRILSLIKRIFGRPS